MKAVRESIARGVSIDQAIRAALLSHGLTIRAFAAKYNVPYSGTMQSVSGAARPTADQVAAFVEEFGGTEREWRELLWLAGKPDDVELPEGYANAKAATG